MKLKTLLICCIVFISGVKFFHTNIIPQKPLQVLNLQGLSSFLSKERSYRSGRPNRSTLRQPLPFASKCDRKVVYFHSLKLSYYCFSDINTLQNELSPCRPHFESAKNILIMPLDKFFEGPFIAASYSVYKPSVFRCHHLISMSL